MATIYDDIYEALRGGTAAPQGVTFDPRAPQGFTIADPAQRAEFSAGQGRLAASAAGDAYAQRAQQERRNQIMELVSGLKGLDPQLQSFMLGKLGFSGAPRVADKSAQALQLAEFKHQLGQGQRDIQNMGLLQRLEQAKERMEMLQGQNLAQRQQAQERQALDQERFNLTQSTARMPSVPFKDATTLLEDMASKGATPEMLTQAAAAMGYQVSGTRATGGFMGFGQRQVPVLGLRSPTGQPGPSSAASETAPSGTMRIRNTKTGDTATGKAGSKVPAGWEVIE